MRCHLRTAVGHHGPAVAAALFFFARIASAGQGPSPANTPASEPAPAAAQQIAVAAPPRPPLPNRVNELLPSWLRVRGEFRERFEAFESAGFVAGRDDSYWLSRVRFNATVTPSRQLSFQVQVQDARVARKQVGPTGTPFKAPFDLRMAFADLGAPASKITVRAGRQELAFGEQRLVGHVSWLNAARTFDGVKATFRSKTFQLDTFAASVVRILDGEFDKSGNGNRFVGAYGAAARLIPAAAVEPYVFWRADRNVATESGTPGDLSQTTAGVRIAGRLPASFEYDLEMARQFGSAGADDVGAWAGHYRVRTPAAPRALRVIGEYNYASGDASPTDGTRGTFDQLYPTPHDKYGLADQVGWRNIHHLRTGVEITPAKGWPVTANYHSWWLADEHDGVYNAGGAVLAPRIAAGAASRHIGQELDVQIARAITPQLQVLAGYAHIFSGSFLKQTTPGASYKLPFVMVTYVFLAER